MQLDAADNSDLSNRDLLGMMDPRRDTTESLWSWSWSSYPIFNEVKAPSPNIPREMRPGKISWHPLFAEGYAL